MLQKRITASQPVNMAIQYTGSTVVLTFLALIFEHFEVHWTVTFCIALSWMVLIVSVGATMLLYYMLRQGALTNVTGLFYCVPPVTALLDYLIFGHTLDFVEICGMALIVVGLVLINRQGRLV